MNARWIGILGSMCVIALASGTTPVAALEDSDGTPGAMECQGVIGPGNCCYGVELGSLGFRKCYRIYSNIPPIP